MSRKEMPHLRVSQAGVDVIPSIRQWADISGYFRKHTYFEMLFREKKYPKYSAYSTLDRGVLGFRIYKKVNVMMASYWETESWNFKVVVEKKVINNKLVAIYQAQHTKRTAKSI